MSGRPSARKSTGPRTAQGKERSKLNALKHGLLSKAVLLEGESRTEYHSLCAGLRNDLQPAGILETVLVENVAALLWRRRRLLQAENAEISEKRDFIAIDSTAKRHVEFWDLARNQIGSKDFLKYYTNPMIPRVAREMFLILREVIATNGFKEDCRLFKRLASVDQDAATPYGLRHVFEIYVMHVSMAKQAEGNGDKSGDADLQQKMLKFIDSRIAELEMLATALESFGRQRNEYKTWAAIIPGQEVSERLLRYETHLSREIDRTLNQLERLQRKRQGQPPPPRIDVDIS